MTGPRPGGVTLVSILAWISGVLGIIGGIVALLATFLIIGWATLILGIITTAVGVGLWRGRNIARVIATIVFIVDIANAVYTIASHPASLGTALVGGFLALIGLLFLFTRAANQFFKR